ncbi:WD40 repeat domain-containing protein [Streptomyces sp. NPDC059989]|uniref:WD40 repeat domain-containing protein n=1 Tax=Streptomyces sp. NPDC059989 TaxID=3347026 RepID=UPI0036C4614E
MARLAALRDGADDPSAADRLSALVHLERGDIPAARGHLARPARDHPDEAEALQAREALDSGQALDARCVARWDLPWQTYPDGSTPPDHDLRVAPDLRLAVAGAADRTVRLWDARSGAQLQALAGHTDRIDSADISGDGRYAVSTGRDRTVRFWDLRQGRWVRTVPITRWVDGEGPENARRFDGHNELDRLAGRAFTTAHRAHPDSPMVNTAAGPVRLDADGSTAVWPEADGRIQVWNLRAGRHLATLRGHSGGQRVTVSADGRRVLAGNGTEHAVMELWDLATGRSVRRWDDYPGRVDRLWLGRKGDLAAVLGRDKVIRLWELYTGRCLRLLRRRRASTSARRR